MTKNTTLLLVLLTLPVWGAEPAPLDAPVIGPPGIAPVDVEANVRRMLEASRSRQGATGAEEPKSASAPKSAPGAPLPVAPKATPVPEPAATVKPAVAGPKPPASAAGTYVPVPEETITIRSLEDVKSVHQQLQEARRRKEGDSAAPQSTPGK